jgi:hypothetical protein
MQFWIKRKNKLLHDYSLVDYILSPKPTIMEHTTNNKILEHNEAAKRLITKLHLDPSLVGTNRNVERVKQIDTFMEEYGNFTNRRGVVAWDNIWIMAAMKMSRLTNGIIRSSTMSLTTLILCQNVLKYMIYGLSVCFLP